MVWGAAALLQWHHFSLTGGDVHMSRRSPALDRSIRCSHVWITGFQCVCLSVRPWSATIVAVLSILKLLLRERPFSVVSHRSCASCLTFHTWFVVDHKCCDLACGRPNCCCVRSGNSVLLSRFTGFWRTALFVCFGGLLGLLHGRICPIQADESKWCGTKAKTLTRDSCCVHESRESW